MSRNVSLTAVLLVLGVPVWRAAAEEVHKPIWEQQAELKLDRQPLLLADQTEATVIEPGPSDWYFRVSATFWGAAITGTTGQAETKVDVDAKFGDIFDNATFGLGMNFETGTGPWSFLLGGMWMHLGGDAQTQTSNDADWDGDFGLLEIAAGYEFTQFKVRGKTVALDALLGFRWTSVSADVRIEQGPSAGRTRDRDKDFVDPYIGLRSRWYISDEFNVTTMVTVGGVGVGSELLATGEVMLEWRFDETWSLLGGYRAFYYDYDEDDFEWSVTMHGPVIGVAARW
jgi:hypothetical protein